MFGAPMRQAENIEMKQLLEDVILDDFETTRDEMRKTAKEEIAKVQAENKKTYNKKRKAPHQYEVSDLVAVRRTQFGVGLKLHASFYGPYEVTKVKRNERYEVRKVGQHKGPNTTTTSADNMKPWVSEEDEETDEEFQDEEDQID